MVLEIEGSSPIVLFFILFFWSCPMLVQKEKHVSDRFNLLLPYCRLGNRKRSSEGPVLGTSE